MQAGFLRLFALRERDEKEELPLKFSLRILLLNPGMLSCSLNLLQCQFDGAASIAALLRCVKDAGWVVGEQIFLHTHKGQRGLQPLWRLRDSRNPCHERGESKEAVVACSTALFNFLFSFLGMSSKMWIGTCLTISTGKRNDQV